LPFESGDKKKIAVRVVTNDGNAAEIIVALNDVKASKAGSK